MYTLLLILSLIFHGLNAFQLSVRKSFVVFDDIAIKNGIRKCNSFLHAGSLTSDVEPSGIRGMPPINRNNPIKDMLSNGIGTNFPKSFIDDSVFKAVKQMNSMACSSILVFDTDGKIAGIFTERDFVTKILDAQKQSTETLMKDVMTPASLLVTASPDISIGECQSNMVKNKVRHLPVVDNGAILGIVSMTEIIRCLQVEDEVRQTSRLFGNTLQQIEEQSKELANFEALVQEETGKQDLRRTTYIASAALLGAVLLQRDFVREYESISMISTFILGYIGIVFENYFEFNKAAVALLMAVSLWVIYAGATGDSGVAMTESVVQLSEKISEVSEVVYFLLGAMTIVEIVDAHQGFKVVTDVINSKSKRGLMWVVGFMTFFMSAILDNLTTTIVMVSLVKKILPDPEDRKLFGAMIVVAANAGGAWTPIGDVTTTMLWINGQISAIPTILGLFLPSIVSVLISIALLQREIPEGEVVPERDTTSIQLAPRGKLVFATGVVGLLSVPVFKAVTGLPPYLGMLSSLGVMWSLTDAIHAGQENDRLRAPAALKKIDTSGVLFFLGILLSVGALDSAGILKSLAGFLNDNIPSQTLIAGAIGIASAVIDNVPLVAATMGMYPISEIPMDAQLWQLIAFCAGTGGSLLVIGSAAGVALMGLEKVDFVWYFKKISLAVLAGYLGGILTYAAQHSL